MNKSLWLVRLLSRHGRLSKQDILDAWRDVDEKGLPMAASTFYDNRRYLEERYNIRLICRDRLYSIEHMGDSTHPIVEQMLRSDVWDTPAEIPLSVGGVHWIALIAEAIEKRQLLQMDYAPYDKAPFQTILAPYCLYPIRGWSYVVGHSSAHSEVRTFALDRIETLRLLPTRYKRPTDFDAATYFRHSFGAYGGSHIKAEHLLIQTDTDTAAYLRQRPLHATQREVGHSHPDGSVCFEMDVALTRDLVKELLSFGAALKVLAPAHLCRTMSEQFSKAAEAYHTDVP